MIEAFESKALQLSDFYFTGEDYRYHFETQGKQRFIDLIRERFNSGVNHDCRVIKWDTAIEQKTIELSRFLAGITPNLSFIEPTPELKNNCDRDFRNRILELTQESARALGIGKSTLYYLRKNAKDNPSLRVYRKTLTRIKSSRLPSE